MGVVGGSGSPDRQVGMYDQAVSGRLAKQLNLNHVAGFLGANEFPESHGLKILNLCRDFVERVLINNVPAERISHFHCADSPSRSQSQRVLVESGLAWRFP